MQTEHELVMSTSRAMMQPGGDAKERIWCLVAGLQASVTELLQGADRYVTDLCEPQCSSQAWPCVPSSNLAANTCAMMQAGHHDYTSSKHLVMCPWRQHVQTVMRIRTFI